MLYREKTDEKRNVLDVDEKQAEKEMTGCQKAMISIVVTACDGRTDGRTHDDSMYRASIASPVKRCNIIIAAALKLKLLKQLGLHISRIYFV